ncbi:MAG: hypothetical protein HUJ80_07545 [Firmicutes bacterium]|nr:hypothetical protein [Bacillota bacterium]
MKDLLIGIATLLIALGIIATLIFGGDGTLQGELEKKIQSGVSAITSLEFKTE